MVRLPRSCCTVESTTGSGKISETASQKNEDQAPILSGANWCGKIDGRARRPLSGSGDKTGSSERGPRTPQFDPKRSISLIGYQRRESAINGRSLEPLAMAACGSESGRSDNALQTAGSDPGCVRGDIGTHHSCPRSCSHLCLKGQ